MGNIVPTTSSVESIGVADGAADYSAVGAPERQVRRLSGAVEKRAISDAADDVARYIDRFSVRRDVLPRNGTCERRDLERPARSFRLATGKGFSHPDGQSAEAGPGHLARRTAHARVAEFGRRTSLRC
jgi:hypothetical protein